MHYYFHNINHHLLKIYWLMITGRTNLLSLIKFCVACFRSSVHTVQNVAWLMWAEACTDLCSSGTGVVGLNPASDMDFSVFMLLYTGIAVG
jgi:hypothetical protein